MNAVDIIIKKRDGLQLTEEEINFFVEGITSKEIPDYQTTSLLMAIYFQGMSDEETYYLTKAMIKSGHTVDLSDIEGFKVDKHSTGGVGDKLTLISCPIAAAAGIKIAKMSGRGLGFTGGTIDKLKSIPGFSVDMPMTTFKEQVKEIGIALMAQNQNIANADKIIYALRDVAGTVESMPLIVSSIMSKKLALGADGIILDVKYGEGALMKTSGQANVMAVEMKKLGESFGKKVEFILSSMEEPLGHQVGNSNEVIEAIETLKGHGPSDLYNQAIELSAKMIHLAGLEDSLEGSLDMAKLIIETGRGLDMFRQWVEAQGGNPNIINDYSLLPGHKFCEEITGEMLGVLQGTKILKTVNAKVVGQASGLAGAGRITKDDILDLGAGIEVCCKGGMEISKDTVVFKIFGNNKEKVQLGKSKLLESCSF